ncbi:MAG: hypothetical protein IJ558_00655 [Treponema sp.]|nr:hypothetical protein [Treponema sp.]
MKSRVSIFAFLLLSVLVLSCSLVTESKTASLSLLLPASSRSDSSADVTSYSISIEPPAFSTVVVDVSSLLENNSIDFYDIAAGSYIVSVNAYSDANVILFSGANTAVIKENETTQVSIVLSSVTEDTADESSESNNESYVIYTCNGVTETLPSSIVFASDSAYLQGTLILQDDVTLSHSLSPSADVTIDLNGHRVYWATSDESLFTLNSVGSALVIKNGSITSSLSVEHKAPLIEQNGQMLALQNLEIAEILTASSYETDETASVLHLKAGTAYFDSVEISQCIALGSSNGISSTLYLDGVENSSALYAKNTTIENCYAYTSSGIAVNGENARLSFVGGHIVMAESPIASSDGESAVLWVHSSSNAVFISSATLFANSDCYPIAVKLSDAGDLNLADGFLFETFDFDTNSVISDSNYTFAEKLGVTQQPTLIAYGEECAQNTSHTAILLENDSYLYVNGNTGIYGTVLFASENTHIQQTGILDFTNSDDIVLNIAFADDVVDAFADSNELIGLFYKPSDVQSGNFHRMQYNLVNAEYTWAERVYVDGAGTYFSVYFPTKN